VDYVTRMRNDCFLWNVHWQQQKT